MREKLAVHRGTRITVVGCFDHFGYRLEKNGGKVVTALFQDVETPEGEFLCAHCHVQYAESMYAYELKHGERVQFLATVMSYKRRLPVCNAEGTMYEVDYGLYHPTGIKTLNRESRLPSLVSEAEAGPVTSAETFPDEEDDEFEEADQEESRVLPPTNQMSHPQSPVTVAGEDVTPPPSRSKGRRVDLLIELQRLAEDHGGLAVVQRCLDFLKEEQEAAM